MNKQLERITQVIEWYEDCDIKHLEQLNNALKVISANIYQLEIKRAFYHSNYINIMHELTKENPVAKSEIEANKKVPELYMLRRVMNAAYRCADSIRTNISYMKNELKNT